MLECRFNKTTHHPKAQSASMQSDFSSLDMSIDLRQQSRMDAAETSMGAKASTCGDAHATMALAQDANDILLGKSCKLRVADFPVDSNGLAMWPRAGVPLACRAEPSCKPAKRACPESDSDSWSDELNDEEDFVRCEQQRKNKKSRTYTPMSSAPFPLPQSPHDNYPSDQRCVNDQTRCPCMCRSWTKWMASI